MTGQTNPGGATYAQEAVRSKGMCGELLDEGRKVCIKPSGHPPPHGDADPKYVDELLHLLVDHGQDTLKRLGLQGTVVVNIEWTDNPDDGWFAIGSKIPDGATSLLAASLRESADEITEEDEHV